MGFFNGQGEKIDSVLLRHLGKQTFRLEESFEYRSEDGSRQYVVQASELPNTDLASVPWFLGWFIPRYGRHTLPALLHDWQYRTAIVTRDEADETFGESMASTHVPRFRRSLMLAAVVMISRLADRMRRVGVILWLAFFAVGTVAATYSLLLAIGVDLSRPSWWSAWFGLVAGVAPIAAAGLWGKHWRSGLWAGYGALIVIPPTIVIVIAQAVYWLAETVLPGDEEPIGTDEL